MLGERDRNIFVVDGLRERHVVLVHWGEFGEFSTGTSRQC